MTSLPGVVLERLDRPLARADVPDPQEKADPLNIFKVVAQIIRHYLKYIYSTLRVNRSFQQTLPPPTFRLT